jgi:hypothetical protein
MRTLGHRLSPLSLKCVSRVLKPGALHFSPTFGVLGFSAPHTIANSRYAPGVGEVAKELYHQRSYVASGIIGDVPRRYGPVGITKSRSRAAYWLTPTAIGTLVGLAKKSAMVLYSTLLCPLSF